MASWISAWMVLWYCMRLAAAKLHFSIADWTGMGCPWISGRARNATGSSAGGLGGLIVHPLFPEVGVPELVKVTRGAVGRSRRGKPGTHVRLRLATSALMAL